MLSREPVRLDPEQAERLELELQHGQAAWPGELLACDAIGARVRFADGPALALGTEVRLSFGGASLVPALQLAARVESREEAEGGRVYSLWFVGRGEVETRLLPALRSLVERRGARRVQADPEEPVLVALVSDGLPRLAGQLAWLSARGLELRVPAEEEAPWAAVESATALLSLPHRPEPLALGVHLRSRRLAGRHALIGLELASAETPGREEAHRALGALAELRRAALERRRAS